MNLFISSYILTFTVISVSCFWFYLKHVLNYWKRYKIPYVPASPIIGNLNDVVRLKKSMAEIIKDIYDSKQAQGHSIVGFHTFMNPTLLIRDPELIKKILVTDFDSFSDRYANADRHSDHIGAFNIFIVKNPAWRYFRKKFNSFFSVSNCKTLFPLLHRTMNEIDIQLLNIVPENEKTEVNVIKLSFQTIIDSFLTCGFGISGNCFLGDNSDFNYYCHKIFEFTYFRAFEFASMFLIPSIASLFKLKFYTKAGNRFFREAFTDAINIREKSKMKRSDLIDKLIEMKNEKNNKLISNKDVIYLKDDVLIGQAVTLLVGGYEGGATVLSFLMIELAKNVILNYF